MTHTNLQPGDRVVILAYQEDMDVDDLKAIWEVIQVKADLTKLKCLVNGRERIRFYPKTQLRIYPKEKCQSNLQNLNLKTERRLAS